MGESKYSRHNHLGRFNASCAECNPPAVDAASAGELIRECPICNGPFGACDCVPLTPYGEKLKAFDDRFRKHEWWKRRIDGTPLANDLACMAVEVFDVLAAATQPATGEEAIPETEEHQELEK